MSHLIFNSPNRDILAYLSRPHGLVDNYHNDSKLFRPGDTFASGNHIPGT